jgi:hypothetical protein
VEDMPKIFMLLLLMKSSKVTLADSEGEKRILPVNEICGSHDDRPESLLSGVATNGDWRASANTLL